MTFDWYNLSPGQEYDLEHFSRTQDILFWLESVKKYGSPVLEIGCGTGRVTIPLAKAKYKIFAVDKSRFMLDRLRENLAQFPSPVRNRVKPIETDMKSFHLGKKFPLTICTFNTFLHLHNQKDRQLFLQNIRNHLSDNGRFILDIINPFAGSLSYARGWKFEKENRLPNGFTSKRYYKHLEHDRKRQVIKIKFKTILYDKHREPIRKWFLTYTSAYLTKNQTVKLLESNGFRIEHIYGDYDKVSFEKVKNPSIQLMVAVKEFS